MAYPYDSPATNLNDYWSSGNYTPGDAVTYIQDNVTPINKNSMRNSVGKEISLLQNFINTTYIGRTTARVGTAYINAINSTGYYAFSQVYEEAANTYKKTVLYPASLGQYYEKNGSNIYYSSLSHLGMNIYEADGTSKNWLILGPNSITHYGYSSGENLEITTDANIHISTRDGGNVQPGSAALNERIDLGGFNRRWKLIYCQGFNSTDGQINLYTEHYQYYYGTTSGAAYYNDGGTRDEFTISASDFSSNLSGHSYPIIYSVDGNVSFTNTSTQVRSYYPIIHNTSDAFASLTSGYLQNIVVNLPAASKAADGNEYDIMVNLLIVYGS